MHLTAATVLALLSCAQAIHAAPLTATATPPVSIDAQAPATASASNGLTTKQKWALGVGSAAVAGVGALGYAGYKTWSSKKREAEEERVAEEEARAAEEEYAATLDAPQYRDQTSGRDEYIEGDEVADVNEEQDQYYQGDAANVNEQDQYYQGDTSNRQNTRNAVQDAAVEKEYNTLLQQAQQDAVTSYDDQQRANALEQIYREDDEIWRADADDVYDGAVEEDVANVDEDAILDGAEYSDDPFEEYNGNDNSYPAVVDAPYTREGIY